MATKTRVKYDDPHDKVMVERVLDKIKLNTATWRELQKDVKEGAGVKSISLKFGIKSGYVKWLLRYLRGEVKT
jgi:hypothetical protein